MDKYRHIKRGTTYRIIGTGTLQASTEPVKEGDVMTVYQSLHDGSIWIRKTTEFMDGRFEQIV